MPCFQLTEPYIAGRDFFEMVNHYLQLMRNIETELNNSQSLADIRTCFDSNQCSVGMKHVRKLYKAVVLLYYDRFHVLDPLSLKKLFMWAFMLRIELDNLSYDSINKYAVGDGINNSIPMFSIISQARKHTEIGNLMIKIPESIHCRNCEKERNELYGILKEIKQK